MVKKAETETFESKRQRAMVLLIDADFSPEDVARLFSCDRRTLDNAVKAPAKGKAKRS